MLLPAPGTYTHETPGTAALERLAGTLRSWPVQGGHSDLTREETWQGWTG